MNDNNSFFIIIFNKGFYFNKRLHKKVQVHNLFQEREN